jgi:hypothetical protein
MASISRFASLIVSTGPQVDLGRLSLAPDDAAQYAIDGRLTDGVGEGRRHAAVAASQRLSAVASSAHVDVAIDRASVAQVSIATTHSCPSIREFPSSISPRQ